MCVWRCGGGEGGFTAGERVSVMDVLIWGEIEATILPEATVATATPAPARALQKGLVIGGAGGRSRHQ